MLVHDPVRERAESAVFAAPSKSATFVPGNEPSYRGKVLTTKCAQFPGTGEKSDSPPTIHRHYALLT